MAIANTWLNHLKLAEDKNRFKQTLKENQHLLRVIDGILDGFITQNDKDRLKKEMYDSANWQLKQADLVGETRAYKKIKDLLKKSLT